MLRWLASPAFNPRETVLLWEPDASRLDERSPDLFADDEDGVTIKSATRLTRADKAVRQTSDAEARRRLIVFQLPWGWSAGDETTLLISPERAGAECFLLIDYLAGDSGISRLSARLETGGTATGIPFELAGSNASNSALQRQAVSLGRLDRQDYRLSLTIPEGCTARIDNIRVSAHVPFAGLDDAGTAQLISSTPNRLMLKAEIRRPSFLVLSEVYYSGWEATVDGRPAPLLKADYILRAVPLMPGEHSVELRFRPGSLVWGLAISALGLAGIACLFARPQLVLGSDCRDQAKER